MADEILKSNDEVKELNNSISKTYKELEDHMGYLDYNIDRLNDYVGYDPKDFDLEELLFSREPLEDMISDCQGVVDLLNHLELLNDELEDLNTDETCSQNIVPPDKNTKNANGEASLM